jgi:hypothetical protein
MKAISKDEWRWAAMRSVALVVLATLPYLIARLTTQDELFYTGFLTNPEDGHTYLAKMRQGARGDWLTHLPYTADPHQGEFLFTYYLALGHLARWFRLPLTAVWHGARILNGFVLLMVLYWAAAHFFHDVARRRFALILTALGSGLGWLAVLLGKMTVDLWVPEGYVFYSIFTNPHFPLAIALMLLILLWSVTPWGTRNVHGRRLVGAALAAAALGLVQPLGMLTVGAALLVYTGILWIQRRRLPIREVACGVAVAAAGSPFVLNAYLVSLRNPAFAIWSAQNQTPSPPPWDVLIGYGLVLLLAVGGLWVAWRRRRDRDWLLIAWAASTAVLVYLPFSLQRRLIMGWIVPLGMLATLGWYGLRRKRQARARVVWALVAVSHLFVIVIALVGALTRHEALFLSQDERAALDWLADSAAPDTLVIAAPDTGLYIPAWAGQRVFYGHRFETAHADERRAQVTAFYRDGERTLLHQPPALKASYVWYGPREEALSGGGWRTDPGWQPVFQQGRVTLYALPEN